MVDYLFTHATVLLMDPGGTVMKDAYVGVSGKKICFIGTNEPEVMAGETIDASGKILMPGLINAHGHTAMTLLRGYADDYNLQEWLNDFIWPVEGTLTEEDIAVGTRLGYMESLQAGITSVSDMYLQTPVTAEVANEVGIRTNLCHAYVHDDVSVEHSPCMRETLYRLAHPMESDGRVKVEIGIHAPYTSSPEEWEEVVSFAKEHGLHMQVHLAETKTEYTTCMEQFQMTPTQAFANAGVFNLPCNAAHGVYLTDEDIAILRKKNVTISHNPISNLKLASGVAPVTKLLAAGVNVAIGTDGASSNNSLDLFEEAKTAAILQKMVTEKPTELPAMQVLSMLTVNGAKAQGRERQVGRIDLGMEADLILVDTEKAHMQPLYHPESQLAYCAKGSDVTLTMVQGKILYRDGEFLTIDSEKTIAKAKEFAKKHN